MRKGGHIFILFAIGLVLLVNPHIRGLGETGGLFANLILAMIPIASLYTLAAKRKCLERQSWVETI